MKNAHQK
jgi:hypothetical protein